MSYERSDIDAVYILHYKSTDFDVFTAQDEEYPFFQYEDHAEIVLSYASNSQSDANDLIRMTLYCKSLWDFICFMLTTAVMHDTKFRFDDAKKALIFESINCIGHTNQDDASPANDVELTMNFTTQESMFSRHHASLYANAAYAQVAHPSSKRSRICGWNSSSTHSNTQHLRKRNSGRCKSRISVLSIEKAHIDLHPISRQASTVYTEHFQVSDAEVSILENTTTSRSRLTIVSRDGLTIISQEREFPSPRRPSYLKHGFPFSSDTNKPVPNTFPDNLSSDHNTDFKSPTYVVQLDETGIRRVRNYAQGFSVLGFSDVTGTLRLSELVSLELLPYLSGSSLTVVDNASVEHLFRLGLDSIAVGDRLLSDE
jgi:hypothetical protein